MKKLLLFLMLGPMVTFGQNYPLITKDISYYGKDFFRLEGTLIPDSLKENPYDRLPLSYKAIVREPVLPNKLAKPPQIKLDESNYFMY